MSPDKPWLGARRFGMSFYDPQSQGLATIGTVLRITEHSTLEDGRLYVQSVGEPLPACLHFRPRPVRRPGPLPRPSPRPRPRPDPLSAPRPSPPPSHPPGAERFKILDVVEERPVMVCEVEYLAEDDDGGAEAAALAGEVGGMFRDVVALSTKLKDTTAPEVGRVQARRGPASARQPGEVSPPAGRGLGAQAPTCGPLAHSRRHRPKPPCRRWPTRRS